MHTTFVITNSLFLVDRCLQTPSVASHKQETYMIIELFFFVGELETSSTSYDFPYGNGCLIAHIYEFADPKQIQWWSNTESFSFSSLVKCLQSLFWRKVKFSECEYLFAIYYFLYFILLCS